MCKRKRSKRWRPVLAALFFIWFQFNAQAPYFQQEVNYKIDVRLNDELHALSAKEEIQYINKSSVSLDFIYFHLWPNAYKNKNTALAKQLLNQGKTDLYYANAQETGFVDSLDFKVNNQSIKWEFDKENPDICKLILNSPLKSLDTIKISTPFYVKIPDAKFSRLGHTGQAYFITQWYPKPAVFDRDGWHPMPYLDQGEFYSEFGSFDVKITLPKNYVLAATGDRIDADEEENFLNDKVIETIKHIEKGSRNENGMSFPASSKEFKTVRFKQYRVHDFAWFADKRYYALHDQIELPNTRRTVDTWVFFTNLQFDLWKDALTYVNEATLFYSYLNGDYPYNHVTAVDGTIMAGGGMEYPNITVIGSVSNKSELDLVITHEVGHNWFYGVLGSNEREHPFLDEGLNSFCEMRYMRAKYPEKKLTDLIGRDSTFRLFGLNKFPRWKEMELAFYVSHKNRTDQPILSHSTDFTEFNYGSIIYCKTPVVLDYMMDVMGEKNFNEAMRFYFKEFKFKHPGPTDFFNTMNFYGGSNLSGFQKYLFETKQPIDYKIKRVKRLKDGSYSITIKNKTGALLPLNLSAYKNNKPVGLIWYDGFEKTRVVTFPDKDVDYFKIDGNDKMPDINRKNNIINVRRLFKKLKPLQFNFITQLDNPLKTQINYVPLIGANYYNGFMLGIVVHNYSIFKKKLEYHVAPMYAFQSKTPTGFADVNYHIFPKTRIQQITLGAKFKSFCYWHNTLKKGPGYINTDYLNYYKFSPQVIFEFKKKSPNDKTNHIISYTNNNLFSDSIIYKNYSIASQKAPPNKNIFSLVNELSYYFTNHRTIHPFSLRLDLQHTASMAKAFAVFNSKINVNPKQYFTLRFFAGSFITGSVQEKGYYSFKASGYNGYQDYLFNDNFIGRQEVNGLGFSQFSETDGALKIWTPLGQSSDWLVSMNIKSPRIFKLPARFFADVASCDGKYLNKEKVLWDVGVNITIWKDIIEIYIPFAYNNDIKKTLDLNGVDFFNRIRFTLNIHKLAPKDFLQNNLF